MRPSPPTLSNRQLKARAKQAREMAEKKRDPTTYVNQTPFRYAERNFKSRTPPPDYSNVISPSSRPCPDQLAPVELANDLRSLSPYFGTSDSVWEQRSTEAYVLKELPGLIIIPNPFTPEAQRHLIQQCLCEYPQAPNTSNLHTHYQVPSTGLWPLFEQEQNGTLPMDDPRYYIPKKQTSISKNDLDDDDDSDQQQRTLAIPLKACDDDFKPDMDVVKADPPAASTVPLLPTTDLIDNYDGSPWVTTIIGPHARIIWTVVTQCPQWLHPWSRRWSRRSKTWVIPRENGPIPIKANIIKPKRVSSIIISTGIR
ncbi:unnamed protein product [Absidia cylindrospora]